MIWTLAKSSKLIQNVFLSFRPFFSLYLFLPFSFLFSRFFSLLCFYLSNHVICHVWPRTVRRRTCKTWPPITVRVGVGVRSVCRLLCFNQYVLLVYRFCCPTAFKCRQRRNVWRNLAPVNIITVQVRTHAVTWYLSVCTRKRRLGSIIYIRRYIQTHTTHKHTDTHTHTHTHTHAYTQTHTNIPICNKFF